MADTRAKRKAQEVDLPELGQDPAERKRLLNVLAQRRYRQRKKDHVKDLEAQVHAVAKDEIHPNPENLSTDDISLWPVAPQSSSLDPISHAQTFAASNQHNQAASPRLKYPATKPVAGPDFLPLSAESGQSIFLQSDIFGGFDAEDLLAFPVNDQSFWDADVASPSVPTTPSSSTTSHASKKSISQSLTMFSATGSPRNQPRDDVPSRSSTGASFQQTPRYSFPDEAHLEILELDLLRGCMAIASRLEVHDQIWSLDAQSPFTDPNISLSRYSQIPDNLQPTLVQMTVPHHPMLDLLPWAAVRDRMITVMSQPVEVRPPQAASPLALLDFVYDIEDSSEGIRISGSDPYASDNWEVGEKVFKSWWWIFDRDVIRRSNELREKRGAPALGASLGSVLGEVL